MTADTIDVAPAVTSASQGTITEVLYSIQEALSSLAGEVPEGILWDAAARARDFVRGLLTKKPQEVRTASAILHQLGFILGRLGAEKPLSEATSEALKHQLDAKLRGEGTPLRPPTS